MSNDLDLSKIDLLPGYCFVLLGIYVVFRMIAAYTHHEYSVSRDFASIDRRLVVLFVLMTLVFVATPKAQAQDQGQAYSSCQSELDTLAYNRCRSYAGVSGETFIVVGSKQCEQVTGNIRATVTCQYGPGSPIPGSPYGGKETLKNYPYTGNCGARPEQFNWAPTSGGQVCYQGCSYTSYNDPDTGQSYYSTYNEGTGAIGPLCTSGDAPEPQVDTDGDGVPDDEDAFPNDPNESRDTDGDGTGDNADIAPDDPNNGQDDGEGNESDNSATGGGTCDAPPACQGDGIACNTNFQMWKTRCAVEGMGGKVTGQPGNCGAGYTCENNAVGCAQLAVQRAQLCSNGDGEGGPGNGTVSGGTDCDVPYVCTGGDPIACASLREQHQLRCALTREGEGDDDYGEDLEPSDYFGVSEGPLDTDALDFTGFLGGRGSCPIFDSSLTAFNVPNEFVQGACTGLDAWYLLVMIMTAIHVTAILGRSVTGGG